LLLRLGRKEAAEELYRRALSIAQEQEAKLWELRAVVSLARLRRDQGWCAEARDLLAPVYGWFTEGFDTPDLKKAKALLDERYLRRHGPFTHRTAGRLWCQFCCFRTTKQRGNRERTASIFAVS